MLYRVKMKSGHSFKFRGVVKFDFDAEKDRVDVEMFSLIFGVRKFSCVGVANISVGEDPDPAGDIMEFINPKAPDGDATAETVKTYFHSGGIVTRDDFKPMLVGDCIHEVFRREAAVPPELATSTFAPLEAIH